MRMNAVEEEEQEQEEGEDETTTGEVRLRGTRGEGVTVGAAGVQATMVSTNEWTAREGCTKWEDAHTRTNADDGGVLQTAGTRDDAPCPRDAVVGTGTPGETTVVSPA
jgi:hypothetical protein